MTIMIPAWQDGALQPVEKLAAHQMGLKHRAVSIFVMAEDHILIQQRALGKYHTPGMWANSCCTHPHWAEDPLICARRRLDEELGMTGLDLAPRGEVEYRAEVGNGLIEHEVVQVYVAQAQFSLSMALNPNEVQAVKWVTRQDLRQELDRTPTSFTPWLHIYMTQHSDLIFGTKARSPA